MLPFAYIFSLYVANVNITVCRPLCQDQLGDLLCKIHCKQVKGCDQYNVDHNSLKCCIGENETDSKQESGVVKTVKKTKTFPVSAEACAGKRRKNRIRCLTVEKTTTPNTTPETPPDNTIYPKMLIYFKDGRNSGQFYILNIKSGVPNKFQDMSIRGICAMTFNNFYETLYFASKHTKQIFKRVLNKQQTVIVKGYILVKAMAMDEERELLFVSEKRQIGLLDGSIYKSIIRTRIPADYLVVDPKQRKIYSSTVSYIYVTRYDGRFSKFLPLNGKSPLAVDPNTNILCYCRERAVTVYNLTTKRRVNYDGFLSTSVTNIHVVADLILVTLKPFSIRFLAEHLKHIHVPPIDLSWYGSDALTTIIN